MINRLRKLLSRSYFDAPGTRRSGSTDEPPPLLPAQVYGAVDALARACAKLKARDAFLGLPGPEAYEVLVDERKLTARLDPRLVPALIALFCGKRRLTRCCSDPALSPLELSLLSAPGGPVVRLSWNMPRLVDSPLVNESAPLRRPLPHPAETEPPLKRRAMIIDDDGAFSLILAKVLEGRGFEVERLPAADEALKRFKSQSAEPHIVLCDVHMPRMDGLTFVNEFRSLSFHQPLVMLTSDDDALLEAELIAAGASAFLRKSEDPRILMAWCSNLLRGTA